jgi:hypothetical protein
MAGLDYSYLHKFLVSLCWLCLTSTTINNPAFNLVLPSVEVEQVLEQALEQASISFAPGLLEALQSEPAPTIEWFKSLPVPSYKHLWGIYLLNWEKVGHRPKIYLGSGTESTKGVKVLLTRYDEGFRWSNGCKQAIEEGYTRTHTTFLPGVQSRPLPT